MLSAKETQTLVMLLSRVGAAAAQARADGMTADQLAANLACFILAAAKAEPLQPDTDAMLEALFQTEPTTQQLADFARHTCAMPERP